VKRRARLSTADRLELSPGRWDVTDFRTATYYSFWHNLSVTAARELAAAGQLEDAARYAVAARTNRRRYIQAMGR
jgi:hypothetical protein